MIREEIEDLVEEVIQLVGASSMADIGKVIGEIMLRIKGRADGRLVNQIVKDKLS
ncbi:MAG: uncharacterized protein PWR10_2120 [Halanaerobiales bacterium]|nr:uncharacterized protein [Halanaerobiales bacterium]